MLRFFCAFSFVCMCQWQGTSKEAEEKIGGIETFSKTFSIFAAENKSDITMASNSDFVQYIADQCGGAGEITTRKMFGDYGIYCNGIIFGLICDDHFFVKPTESGRQLLRTLELRKPYDGAKDYFYIAEVDDHEYLSELVRETCKELPKTKKK